jgi:hypothetical protein
MITSNAAQAQNNLTTTALTVNNYLNTRSLTGGINNSHTGISNPWVFPSNNAA